jgi:hypothetical protein
MKAPLGEDQQQTIHATTVWAQVAGQQTFQSPA